MGFRKNKKKAGLARGSVDKAQNELLKGMKKQLDELKDTVEPKYGYQVFSDIQANSYDGSTTTSRQAQIYDIDIGTIQGTTDTNRIGDQVTFKHIDMSYRINLRTPRSTEFVPPQVTTRVMLFWDNQPSSVTTAGLNATNPVYWPQLLQLCTSGTTTADQKALIMMSEKDWDQRKRFSIIYDKTHTLSSNLNSLPSAISTGANGPRGTTSCVRFSKNYKGQKIRYTNAGTLPSNRKLYMAYLSDVPPPSSGTPPLVTPSMPEIHLQTRVIYEDA